jgi:hypothetical protein
MISNNGADSDVCKQTLELLKEACDWIKRPVQDVDDVVYFDVFCDQVNELLPNTFEDYPEQGSE